MKKVFPSACLIGLLLTSNHLIGNEEISYGVRTRPPVKAQPKETEITPSARGCPKNNCFFASAEFLYWLPWEDDMTYARDCFDLNGNAVNGKLASMPFKWTPGVRVGVGYNLPHDGWDISIKWTHYNSSSSAHIKNSEKLILPLYAIGPLATVEFPTSENTTTHWKLHFNVLDLQMGRSFYQSKRLAIRPNVGVKTAWINQPWKMNYGDLFGGLLASKPLIATHVRSKLTSKSWGIGPEVGLDGKWHFTDHFSIIGNASTALLYTQFDLKLVAGGFDANNGAPNGGHVHKKIHPIQPMLQLLLGIDWGRCFNNDRYFFELSASYEFQYWWNQMRYIGFVNDYPHGSLAFSGLTLMAKIDF